MRAAPARRTCAVHARPEDRNRAGRRECEVRARDRSPTMARAARVAPGARRAPTERARASPESAWPVLRSPRRPDRDRACRRPRPRDRQRRYAWVGCQVLAMGYWLRLLADGPVPGRQIT